MIDVQSTNLLAAEEQELRDAGNPELATLVRLARRYLALREHQVTTLTALHKRVGCADMSAEEIRANFDAHADRLLRGDAEMTNLEMLEKIA